MLAFKKTACLVALVLGGALAPKPALALKFFGKSSPVKKVSLYETWNGLEKALPSLDPNTESYIASARRDEPGKNIEKLKDILKSMDKMDKWNMDFDKMVRYDYLQANIETIIHVHESIMKNKLEFVPVPEIELGKLPPQRSAIIRNWMKADRKAE